MSYDGTLRNGPRPKHAAHLEPKVEVEISRGVLVDDEQSSGSVETAPIGSGVVSGERFARYLERLLSSSTVGKLRASAFGQFSGMTWFRLRLGHRDDPNTLERELGGLNEFGESLLAL